MERVWGPVNGFWLAAYAAPAVAGERFCSYAKICWTRPDSYWEADALYKLFGGEWHASPEAALAAVATEARRHVAHVPASAVTVAELRRRDKLPVPRLFVNAFLRPRLA